ncbi:restriction endonuclease [Meridianimaribacter sp. CL38]|uniref:HNH endonuclease n=1 Tax=Meridianimaribacter sp. CL38 TaxID=2213021 RepID=UPI00103DB504|nr:HNH endonuclease [Meridianimaribacter sp. CL38]TBV25540.1 restriction endonuclease [Meridianimaribacter sp. CL38]
MSTWKEDIIEAFKLIGGEGHYTDIYESVESVRPKEKMTKTWKATVRGTVERFSSDSEAFNGKEDIFYSVEGLGKGIWGLNDYKEAEVRIDLTEDDIEFPEGKKALRKHIARERNPKLIRLAKEKFINENGRLLCEVCDFDFEKEYGELGKGFIEGHHSKPVSELEENEKTKIEDIVMVCSNCHKMLHRRRPWLSKTELKKLKNTIHNNT